MAVDNLQKLIQQNKPFPNEYLKAEVGLIYVCNLMNSQFQTLLKEYQITQQQYNVLRILRGQYPKPSSINMIRERMLDKMSDASRIVDRLVSLEFVIKKIDETDKRITNVFISKKALELLLVLDQKVNERDTILKQLDESEILEFNKLFNKIVG